MKRKVYQNPTMKVVELTRRTCLLVASGGDTVGSGHATTQDYTVNGEKEI
jgi:hypothetical protein